MLEELKLIDAAEPATLQNVRREDVDDSAGVCLDEERGQLRCTVSGRATVDNGQRAGEESERRGLHDGEVRRERPNVWRQWRAQRVHCTPGLGSRTSGRSCRGPLARRAAKGRSTEEKYREDEGGSSEIDGRTGGGGSPEEERAVDEAADKEGDQRGDGEWEAGRRETIEKDGGCGPENSDEEQTGTQDAYGFVVC